MVKAFSLKTKISMAVAFVLLLIVLLISLLSNYFINKNFVEYISRQHVEKTEEIISSLSQQFNPLTRTWDLNFIHAIGMYALYDGYIIRVENVDKLPVWDAQQHDMSACAHIMNEIKERMANKYPSVNGEFVMELYPLLQGDTQIGYVEISYYGPFFLSENDFDFLNTLNTLLISITFVCLLVAMALGRYLAGWISKPILKTVVAAQQLAAGDFRVQIQEKTTTTELNQLIDSINHLSKILDQQETLRKQLSADVAHELRTPLTTVATHMEAMIEGVWTPTPERLQSCYEEIERISKLVMDLERLTKTENDSLNINRQQVDICKVLEKTADSLLIEFQNKQLLLRIEVKTVNTIIAGDPDRLHQLFYNLLTNAIKYTPEQGNIMIQVTETEHDIIIDIKDSGIGISEADLPYIFERFYRAEKSRNRATGGSGIGLAIVKAVVQAHEGKISVQSKVGQGSCFTVALKKVQK